MQYFAPAVASGEELELYDARRPVSVASAQQPGGMTSTQQVTRFQLATLPEVQANLNLSNEQKRLAKTQLDKLYEKAAAQTGLFDLAVRAEMAKSYPSILGRQ